MLSHDRSHLFICFGKFLHLVFNFFCILFSLLALQNSRASEAFKTGGKDAKLISKELASAINDGLYFYEQVEFSVVLSEELCS